jgi:hypothetical protein
MKQSLEKAMLEMAIPAGSIERFAFEAKIGFVDADLFAKGDRIGDVSERCIFVTSDQDLLVRVVLDCLDKGFPERCEVMSLLGDGVAAILPGIDDDHLGSLGDGLGSSTLGQVNLDVPLFLCECSCGKEEDDQDEHDIEQGGDVDDVVFGFFLARYTHG